MNSTSGKQFYHGDDPLEHRYSAAERALLARIDRYFRGAVRGLPKRDQTRALAAPDDFWTLMETLALTPVQESPELNVRLRGAIARRKFLETEGGLIGPSNVAKLLHISRQAVGQRRAAGKLLGVETPRGYMYPVWQFDGHGTVEGFQDILNALRDHDPWTQVIFFLTEDDSLGGKRPLDLLRRGKLAAVLRAARLYGVQAAV